MEALIEEYIKAAVKMVRKITEGYNRRGENGKIMSGSSLGTPESAESMGSCRVVSVAPLENLQMWNLIAGEVA
jgi:hypothetical protein